MWYDSLIDEKIFWWVEASDFEIDPEQASEAIDLWAFEDDVLDNNDIN